MLNKLDEKDNYHTSEKSILENTLLDIIENYFTQRKCYVATDIYKEDNITIHASLRIHERLCAKILNVYEKSDTWRKEDFFMVMIGHVRGVLSTLSYYLPSLIDAFVPYIENNISDPLVEWFLCSLKEAQTTMHSYEKDLQNKDERIYVKDTNDKCDSILIKHFDPYFDKRLKCFLGMHFVQENNLDQINALTLDIIKYPNLFLENLKKLLFNIEIYENNPLITKIIKEDYDFIIPNLFCSTFIENKTITGYEEFVIWYLNLFIKQKSECSKALKLIDKLRDEYPDICKQLQLKDNYQNLSPENFLLLVQKKDISSIWNFAQYIDNETFKKVVNLILKENDLYTLFCITNFIYFYINKNKEMHQYNIEVCIVLIELFQKDFLIEKYDQYKTPSTGKNYEQFLYYLIDIFRFLLSQITKGNSNINEDIKEKLKEFYKKIERNNWYWNIFNKSYEMFHGDIITDHYSEILLEHRIFDIEQSAQEEAKNTIHPLVSWIKGTASRKIAPIFKIPENYIESKIDNNGVNLYILAHCMPFMPCDNQYLDRWWNIARAIIIRSAYNARVINAVKVAYMSGSFCGPYSSILESRKEVFEKFYQSEKDKVLKQWLKEQIKVSSN